MDNYGMIIQQMHIKYKDNPYILHKILIYFTKCLSSSCPMPAVNIIGLIHSRRFPSVSRRPKERVKPATTGSPNLFPSSDAPLLACMQISRGEAKFDGYSNFDLVLSSCTATAAEIDRK